MMEPEDDDVSYTSEGDPIFTIIDEDDNDDLPSLLDQQLEDGKKQNRKQKRVGGAAVAGGVTGALLAVPLVAIDVTVLAIAGPAVAVVAAGGAAYVAATTTGNPKEMVQAGFAQVGDELRRRKSLKGKEGDECKDYDDATVLEDEEEDPCDAENGRVRFPWVQGVFQRKQASSGKKLLDEMDKSLAILDNSAKMVEERNASFAPELVIKREESKEGEEKRVSLGLGLSSGGLLWNMSQKKQILVEAEEASQEEETTGRGPLGWLTQRRPNKLEAATVAAAKQETGNKEKRIMTAEESEGDAQSEDKAPCPNDVEENDVPPAKRTWMPPVLARRLNLMERDDTDYEEYDGESSSGSEYDSDDDDSYWDESDSEEEEVVFGFDENSVRYEGALFSDGIAEQAQPVV